MKTLQMARKLQGNMHYSPIRKIMEMAEPKNLVRLGLKPEQVISFAGGWVNHEAPEELRKEYLNLIVDKKLFHQSGGYSATDGDVELRKMLSLMEMEIYGLPDLDADNIIIGQSSTQLAFALMLALLNPKEKVLVFDPTYANYLEQLSICLGKQSIVTLKVFDETSWSMQNEDEILASVKEIIREHKVKAILLSSPDNPTGHIPSDGFIARLLQISWALRVFVLIDHAYKAQYFGEMPKHFSFSPNKYENLITIHSNSKWCRGLGRRLGWIEANKQVIQALKAVQQTMILCSDTMHQMALANYLRSALPNGSLKKYFEESRNKYLKAAEFTCQCIEKYLKKRCTRPEGGLYTVVDIGTDGDAFVQEVLKNTGVIFVPGNGFGSSLKSAIRVSFGPLVNDLGRIEEGFKRVQDFLQKQV